LDGFDEGKFGGLFYFFFPYNRLLIVSLTICFCSGRHTVADRQSIEQRIELVIRNLGMSWRFLPDYLFEGTNSFFLFFFELEFETLEVWMSENLRHGYALEWIEF
jgi:hypothetical protein